MRNRKSNFIINFIIFFLISVGLLLTGLFLAHRSDGFVNNGVKVQATITDINVDRTGNSNSYHVYVEYEVDGKTYNNELGTYYSGMAEGQTIDIYYLTSNPNRIEQVSSSQTVSTVLYCVSGGLFLVSGIFVYQFISSVSLEKLKKTGNRISCKVKEVRYNANFSVNRVHPYKVYCENGSEQFVSPNIFDNLSYIQVGDSIDVYKSSVNNKYYIDVDSVKKQEVHNF